MDMRKLKDDMEMLESTQSENTEKINMIEEVIMGEEEDGNKDEENNNYGIF